MTPQQIEKYRSMKGELNPNWKGGDPTLTPHARYYLRNRDKFIAKGKKNYAKFTKEKHALIRKQTLMIVGKGNAICEKCGCDDARILEINHLNGVKNKKEIRSGLKFWKMIIAGDRKTDDLNVLCKACNIIYYINRNYGINNHEIKWTSKK